MKNKINGGEQKIQEYIDRIKNGESKDYILKDLPTSFITGIEAGLNSSQGIELELKSPEQIENNIPPQYKGLDSDALDFIWTIPEYTDQEKTESEKKKKQEAINFLKQQESQDDFNIEEQKINLKNEAEIEQIREEITSSPKENNSESKSENEAINSLVGSITQGRRREVIDLYNKWLKDFNNPDSKKALISGLFGDVYNKYRIAEYPTAQNEQEIWKEYLNNSRVPVNNKKSEWMYRGVFPDKDVETVTRGSFNVNVTPELIDSLDQMILDGKIKANYKFGEPNSQASPSERHDSITIYFLEKPSDEAIKELSSIVKPYVRGDNLLGKKIDDGFFMSEIGSIETKDIEKFIEELKSRDEVLAEAIKNYTSPRPGQGTSLKMSEAQFYAIKDVAKALGYNLSYDNGFILE
jgi:hypothetical protein